MHSRHLAPVLDNAEEGSLLDSVYQHGDTMFNVPQMNRIKRELARIRDAHPDLRTSVEVLEILIDKAVLDRGYLWISGD
ncbi:hypothetical protein CLV63_11071 [Murinocardiopsis flavida]|uniref:Uncharacterized protein n=1 Tax=Murinocardiopsis flavida TaxID=645275 RepID=A0A2P8DHS3_9ACTN|nr:hypothetical protein [Murinocardiopsis flavida]PSK96774.1 hypothetical protein CLV63_11071 [Murinocardiopsis flavida]